jgi:hypothetical protein
MYSQLTTTSDEAFALYLIKYYDQLPQKPKKAKLVGDKLEEAMVFLMNE